MVEPRSYHQTQIIYFGGVTFQGWHVDWGDKTGWRHYVFTIQLMRLIKLNLFSGPHWATWNLQSGRYGESCALLLNPETAEQHLRPLKQEHSLLLQRRQAVSDPRGSPVRAVSDQHVSSIPRRGSRRVMLLGNGALTPPIMLAGMETRETVRPASSTGSADDYQDPPRATVWLGLALPHCRFTQSGVKHCGLLLL